MSKQKLTKAEQAKRVQAILRSGHFTNCLDCGFQYMPMSKITEHLCPNCQAEDIINLEDDNTVYEEVSFDNEDFDIPLDQKKKKRRR